MYTTSIFSTIALLALGRTANAIANSYEDALAARQDASSDAYITSVCSPNITSPIIPPCQEITNIESACLPNGTTPLALLAHAQCMCGGSYFSDWIGCLNCQFVHGARSPAVTSAFHSIITSASNELCTGTPTNSFQAIFQSLMYDGSGSATQTTDLFPGRTEISLYFTASGSQGPGVITGSATGATRVVTTTSASVSASATGMGTGSISIGANGGKSTSVSASGGGSGSGSATAGSQSTSSSKAGVAPTGVWIGGVGFLAGVVGVVVL